MANLFQILDGINSSDYADETLDSVDAIVSYADACEESITNKQAERIAKVGKKWRDEQVNSNGEWSRMRHEAMNALED